MFILAHRDPFFQIDDQYASAKNFNALRVSEYKTLNLLSQIMIENKTLRSQCEFSISKRKFLSITSRQDINIFVNTEARCDISHLGHIKIVIKCNALCSHNFAHNCDHATFNVDCCYDIMQQLLHTCMSRKGICKVPAHISHFIFKLLKYLRLLIYKQPYFARRSDEAFVLYFEGKG